MKEMCGVSGIHGFCGRVLSERLDQFKVLGRNGEVPSGLDVIFDLAAFGNLYNQKDVREIYRANVFRVCDMLNNLQPETRLICVSTSSVMLPKQTFYSASKKAMEEMVKLWHQETGQPISIVRPFSLTGRGEQETHLIPKLIDSCLNGTEMSFVSDPVHDFIDVEDFVSALIAIKDKAQFKGEVYQVGTGIQYSNKQVLELIESVVGTKANVYMVDNMRSYDTNDWRADTTRIRSLGWKPKKTLKQSINEMVNYARKNFTDF